MEQENVKPRTRRHKKVAGNDPTETQIIESLRQSIEKPNAETIEHNLNKPDDEIEDKIDKRRRRRRDKTNLENGVIKEESFERENAAFEDEEMKQNAKSIEVPERVSATPKQRRRKDRSTAETKNAELSGLPTNATNEPIRAETVAEDKDVAALQEKNTKKPRRVRRKEKGNEMEMHENVAGPQDEVARVINDELTHDDGKVVNVQIHRTDRLKTDLNVLHPMVRVSIVDIATGALLIKQNRNRRVVSYNEDTERVSNILPVMTQPFEFKYNRGTIPSWNESIILNENSNYIINNPNVVIFFELLDLNSAYSIQKSQNSSHNAFKHIAWAFLRPLGSNNTTNTQHKVRLQLYECGPFTTASQGHEMLHVYNWWRMNLRQTYPSTLYVTVASIQLSDDKSNTTTGRSMFPHVSEGDVLGPDGNPSKFGGTAFANKSSRNRGKLQSSALAFWSRLPGQLCHVPNEAVTSLVSPASGFSPANQGGYSCLAFSPNGQYLAAAAYESSQVTGNTEDFPIVLFDLYSGSHTPCEQFPGHNRIVHCIAWCPNSVWLATGSADGTCRLWRIVTANQDAANKGLANENGEHEQTENSLLEPSINTSQSNKVDRKVLCHPCFVYAIKFHPKTYCIIITASYDKIIRVWDVSGSKKEVVQRLDGHKGYINSVVFRPDGLQLFSGDSKGAIHIWNTPVDIQYLHTQPYSRNNAWTCQDTICELDLTNKTINCIILSTSGQRLYVHARDGSIRLIDLKIKSMVLKFHGIINNEKNMKSCLSPCGSFLFCGNEDMTDGSSVYIWNAQTGDHVAVYKDVNLNSPVTTIDYHPKCHLLAFSGIGSGNNILLYGYNSAKTRLETDSDDYNADRRHLVSSYNPAVTASTLTGLEDNSMSSSYSADRLKKAIGKMNTVMEANRRISKGAFESSRKSHVNNQNTPEFRGQSIRLANKPSAVDAIPMSLNATGTTGKANFTFKPPPGPSNKNRTHNRQLNNRNYLGDAVALYDYKGDRSDELSFVKGELIRIVFKDGQNWLLGETNDGCQGYLPSNYVDFQDNLDTDELLHTEEEPRKSIRFQDEVDLQTTNNKNNPEKSIRQGFSNQPIEIEKELDSTNQNDSLENSASSHSNRRRRNSKQLV